MAHGDAREGKWSGNWRMQWVASILHTTSEHCVSSNTTITTADAHASAVSSRLNWRPRRFKWTRPFRRKTISGFCACAITFQMDSSSKIPLRATRFPLKHTSNGWSMPTLLCNWICKWPKQNNKSGIQFDIKTHPAPIHTISYAFILTILQNLIKSRVQVYYIVYRITKTETLNITCDSILISQQRKAYGIISVSSHKTAWMELRGIRE